MSTESSVRSILAKAHGQDYSELGSLKNAKNFADAYAIMEGDYGGTIYLTIPVTLIQCSEETLEQLLLDIDARYWGDTDGCNLSFERIPATTTRVAGGMGGGVIQSTLWLHSKIDALGLFPEIEAVISGKKLRLTLP